MNSKGLTEIIKQKAKESLIQKDDNTTLITNQGIKFLSEHLNKPQKEIELLLIEEHIYPAKYYENINKFGAEAQIKLLKSNVIVLGCGTLSYYTSQILARIGVGQITLVDGDIVKETTLNRSYNQQYINKNKAEALKEILTNLNSAIDVNAIPRNLDPNNVKEIITKDYNLVIDTIENITIRKAIFTECLRTGIPIVHGIIAGFWLQIGTIKKGYPTVFDRLSEDFPLKLETPQISAPFTYPVAAGIITSEATKILTNTEAPLFTGKLAWFDLQNNLVEIIEL